MDNIPTVRNLNKESGLKMRTAIYTRVSTLEQSEKGVSLEGQLKRAKVEVELYPNTYEFDESKHHYVDGGESGGHEHRPALDRMMRDIENGEIDIILVFKIDRLFRNLLYLLQFMEKVSKLGVIVKSLEDGIDTSDSQSMWKVSFMGMVSDIERSNIRLRTISGKITKANNKYYVGGGKSSYGYKFIRETGGIKLKVENNEAAVVNRIFELYVKKNKSLGEIAKILTLEGIPTKDDAIRNNVKTMNQEIDEYKKTSDSDTSHLVHKKGTKKIYFNKWHPTSIRKILSNTMYIGYTYYGKTKKERNSEKDKYVYVNNNLENAIEIPCDPILKDMSLFDEAQKLLERNKHGRERKSNYIFTGLVKCGKCGYTYNGYKTTKGTLSYRCKGSMSSSNLAVKCRNAEISETKLFQHTWGELYKRLMDSDSFKSVVSNKEKNREIISDFNARLRELNKLIDLKEVALRNVEKESFERRLSKKDKERYQDYINEYKNDIRILELEVVDIKKEISNIRAMDEKYKDLDDFNKDHENIIKNITYEKKIGLIKKFVKEIIRNQGNINTKFYYLDNLVEKDFGFKNDNGKTKSDIDLYNSDPSNRGIGMGIGVGRSNINLNIGGK